jgi:hypothetical protein
MAKRRMLSIDFCESDTFYMLSPTARMLYVHFILNADDDGFVDKWRTVLRCSRIERRHYVTLRDEGYVIELNERLIVITDWHRHNTIRADRYIATVYSKELQGLALDENKRYYKAKEEVLVATCVPQSRIDKNREDKTREEKTNSIGDSQKRFTKPSLEEVKQYCAERGNKVDAEKWYDYYEANGWKVGKNSMKDWKASVRTWERNGYDSKAPKAKEDKWCKPQDDNLEYPF